MSGEEGIYITFDIDWAHDSVLSSCIDLCDQYDIEATFFATHMTEQLERINDSKNCEIGAHPNFKPLLEGKSSATSAKKILEDVRVVVPDARSIRSHSVVQSGGLLDLFVEFGFTHDTSTWIPSWANIQLKAWRDWNGLIRAPFYWSDDTYYLSKRSQDITKLLDSPGLKIFNFHPIHIFLNTEDIQRYELSRPAHHDPRLLEEYRCRSECEGAKVFLTRLISEVQQRDLRLGVISDIRPESY